MDGGNPPTAGDAGRQGGFKPSRRDALKIGAVVGLPLLGFGWLVTKAGDPEVAAQNISPEFVRSLCDIVVPATETPGAVQAGVPEFLPTAFRSGLFGGDALTLGKFSTVLDGRIPQGSFLSVTAERRYALISEIDAATFAKRGPPDPNEPMANTLWRTIKSGIVQSYYTSEAGGSQELTFELIPGDRYRADVAISEVPYLSNYWMENVF